MNVLIVGQNKAPILELLPDSYLLIDNGPIIDAVETERKVIRFDVSKHSFNPLRGMNDLRARQLAATIYAAFPQGENTLTVRNGKRALTKLLRRATRLDRVRGDRKDPSVLEALATLEDIFFSEVARNVLCGFPRGNRRFPTFAATNFSPKKIIHARLDRAVLGDLDAYVIGNMLIESHKGNVVIPDWGFYQSPSHMTLLQQERLIAGINSFAEIPKFRSEALLVHHKTPSRCTYEDAELLAQQNGLRPDPTKLDNPYNNFIDAGIS